MRGKARSPIQVLELEEAPIVHIPDAGLDTTDPSVEPSKPQSRRRAVLSRLRAHSRLIAIALTTALVGAVYVGTRPDPEAGSRAQPTGTPTASPAPQGPVLREPANGWAVFALEHGFTLLDLPTGAEHSIEVEGSILEFAPSPRGGRIAYTDEVRVLYVTTAQGRAPVTIATEVSSFSWTPDGDALVVGRSQTDGQGSERMRVELISLADRTPLLLMESQWFAGPVISSGFTHLVTLYEGDTPSVFDLQPGSKPRLIRKNAALLDASTDGRHALLATNNGQRLIMVDLQTKKARRIGPDIFLTAAAKFSPDGRTAAVTGTSHFTLEESHCEAPEATCDRYPYPTDQTLWSLDVKTLELSSIRSWPSPEFASAPVWGPNGWVFMANSQGPVAISMTDPSKTPVEFTTTYGAAETAPKYLA
ncbi:MAG: hypothetical protein WEB06_11795 [Actinomycetota bacterium]